MAGPRERDRFTDEEVDDFLYAELDEQGLGSEDEEGRWPQEEGAVAPREQGRQWLCEEEARDSGGCASNSHETGVGAAGV
jgi:hypothetical protein